MSDPTFFLRYGDSYQLLTGLPQAPDTQFVIKGVSCIQQQHAGAGNIILHTSEAAVNSANCEAVVFVEPAMAAFSATQSLAFGEWDAVCAILDLVVAVGLKDFESQVFECRHRIHCVICPPTESPEIPGKFCPNQTKGWGNFNVFLENEPKPISFFLVTLGWC